MRPVLRLALSFVLLFPTLAFAGIVPGGWQVFGDQEQDLFGFSVAPAGDVNHDGYGDVLVGAPRYDFNYLDNGRVFLFLGSASGLATTPSWAWSPDEDGAQAGYVVASGGDVNGDGTADILVGAPYWDSPQGDDAGGVFVFLGSAGGPGATPWDTLYAGATNGHFGWSAATAGDVDGDLDADVIVGAPNLGNGHAREGATYVFLGNANKFDLLPVFTLEGNATSARMGTSVSGAGDVNGDGYADVVFGAPGAGFAGSVTAGRAYVYAGAGSGIGAQLLLAGGDADSTQFGWTVANAGDVNADGYADVLIGSPGSDFEALRGGRIDLFYGGSSGPVDPGWTMYGNFEGERFGSALATAGDLDGDGYADFLLGRERVPEPSFQTGQVLVVFGGLGGPGEIATLELGPEGAGFAAAVATTGDTNGDGYAEVLVGAPTFGGSLEGGVFSWNGVPSGPIPAAGSPLVGVANSAFGLALAVLPRIDGSAFPSLLIGSGVYGATQAGHIDLFHGKWGSLDALQYLSIDGPEGTSNFGSRVCDAGDVDRDTYTDFLVSVPGMNTGGPPQHGKVTLYRGSGAGPVAAPWVAEGTQAQENFGSAIAGRGDVNGDGYHDVLIGEGNWDSASAVDCGRVLVYPGGPGGLGPAMWLRNGTATDEHFGTKVAMVGDLDADGYSDFAVGIQPSSGNGRVEVYFGGPGVPDAAPAWTLTPSPPRATFYFVAGAGDWNGDGIGDLVVGSPGLGSKVFVYSGSRARSQPTQPMWTCSEPASVGLGYAVAGGFDVDGDGYSDVVAGDPNWTSGQSNEGRVVLFRGRPMVGNNHAISSDGWFESDLTNAFLGQAVLLGDLNDDGFADVFGGAAGAARTFAWFGGGEGVPQHTVGNEALFAGSLRWAPARLDHETQFGALTQARSAAGRTRVAQEFEVQLQGTPFTGVPSRFTNPYDTFAPQPNQGSYIMVSSPVSIPWKATSSRWRRRQVTSSPFFPRSRWLFAEGRVSAEHDFRSGGAVTGVDGDPGPAPMRVQPNPQRGGAAATIAFALAAPTEGRLDVYDVEGRHVRAVARGAFPAGRSTRAWDGLDHAGARAAPGIYFVTLRAGKVVETTRIVRLP
jgi:hypothetical protein